jgi:hypothetical protein
MFNYLSKIESFMTGGPWYWRYIGGSIVIGVLVIVYIAMS